MSIITSRPDEPTSDQLPSVSINNHHLKYEPSGSRIGNGRIAAFAKANRPVAMALAVVAVMVLVAGIATAAGTLRVGAAEAEVTIASVHFDLAEAEAPPSSGISASGLSASGPTSVVRYRSLVVDYGGSAVDLAPLTGTVRVNLSQDQAPDMAADLDGLRIGSAAPDFADSLADAVSSSDVHRFVRFTPTDDGSPISVDVTYARELRSGDFLLVQERLGDAALELAAVDAAGVAIGATVVVGPTYQWNTGHGAPPTEAAWVSAIAVDRFATGGAPVAAIRVVGGEAEFKLLALEASAPAAGAAAATATDAAASEVGPPDAAEVLQQAEPVEIAEPIEASEPPPFAAVGIEAGIQPAIAVDGAGCESAAEVGSVAASSAISVGQAATYCFTVTNLGTTHLKDMAISDPELGLVNAELPQHSGPQVLEPGQQAVYYHHGVVADPAGRSAIVTATPIDAAGDPIDGFDTSAAAAGGAALAAPASEDAARTTGPTESDIPAVLANVIEESAQQAEATEAPVVPVTELALTGMVTEPWVIVIFAMAFIFIGYTAFAAFKERSNGDRTKGHDQLDALGFD